MAGNLQIAFDKIVQACNDPNIGYYAAYPQRTTITLGASHVTYCDCSSLIAWGLTQGGFFSVNPWFATGAMPEALTAAGFQRLPTSVDTQPGDIVWRHNYSTGNGHTEMVYEAFGTNCRTMGAHGREGAYATDFASQVSIKSGMSSASSYDAIFRYGQGVVPFNVSWIQTAESDQRHMTEQETYNNAICITAFLSSKGFTTAAIAAVIANSEYESAGINPNCWQNFTISPGNGYGIFQYTPSTKYMDYARENNIDRNDADQNGNGQLQYLIDKDGEWGGTYPITWEGFQKMTDPTAATEAFMRNFERPGSYASLPTRQERARYWFAEIPNFPTDIGIDIPTTLPFIGGIIADLKRRKILL